MQVAQTLKKNFNRLLFIYEAKVTDEIKYTLIISLTLSTKCFLLIDFNALNKGGKV